VRVVDAAPLVAAQTLAGERDLLGKADLDLVLVDLDADDADRVPCLAAIGAITVARSGKRPCKRLSILLPRDRCRVGSLPDPDRTVPESALSHVPLKERRRRAGDHLERKPDLAIAVLRDDVLGREPLALSSSK